MITAVLILMAASVLVSLGFLCLSLHFNRKLGRTLSELQEILSDEEER